MSKLHIKKGDTVYVNTGENRGATGKVLKVFVDKQRALVEGVNMITKAQKPNPMAGIQGGLVKKEAAIDSSKVMLFCPACNKATRIKNEVKDGKKVRVCKHCGETLDV